VGLADITELIFLILGLLLIVLEIAVVPGFGIVGIPGLILVLYSIFKMLMGDNPSSADFYNAYLGLSIGIILSTIFSIILYRMLPKTQFYKNNIPFSTQRSKDGYSIAKDYKNLIGQEGLAATDLRPSGKIEIEGKIYQAISSDDYINHKQNIVILGVNGNQLVVKKV
jgi:membrane-bound serine protease (ClpP class)